MESKLWDSADGFLLPKAASWCAAVLFRAVVITRGILCKSQGWDEKSQFGATDYIVGHSTAHLLHALALK